MGIYDEVTSKAEKNEKVRYQYLDGDFEVWIDNGQRKHLLRYPTHYLRGPLKDQESIKIEWTYERLIDALRQNVRAYEVAYGGKWQITVLDRGETPKAYDRDDGTRRREAEQIILNGPDVPGKRFLLARGDMKDPFKEILA